MGAGCPIGLGRLRPRGGTVRSGRSRGSRRRRDDGRAIGRRGRVRSRETRSSRAGGKQRRSSHGCDDRSPIGRRRHHRRDGPSPIGRRRYRSHDHSRRSRIDRLVRGRIRPSTRWRRGRRSRSLGGSGLEAAGRGRRLGREPQKLTGPERGHLPESATRRPQHEPHREPCGCDAHQDDQNNQNFNLRGF